MENPNYKSEAGKQYGDLFSYTEVDGGYGVTGFHGRNKETIIFSNRHEALPVKQIMKGSFAEENDIQRIIVTEGIKAIGDYAFKDCWKLTQAILPNTLSEIGQSAFERCYNLNIPSLPSQVSWIGMYAFADTRLEKVNLPSTVYWVGEGVFSNCKHLKDVVISPNLTAIADKMFKGCESLSEVKLPDTIQSIGSEAFEGCSSLKSITIPASVQIFGENVFLNVNPEFHILCQRGSEAEKYATSKGIRIEFSNNTTHAKYGEYAKPDPILDKLFSEGPVTAPVRRVEVPEQHEPAESRSLLKKKIEELEKLLAKQTVQDYSEALKIIAACRLPLDMHLLYGNLIERIAVLEKTAEKYKDDYQSDLTQFYDYYIPEVVHITATFLGYIDDRVGKAIVDSAEKDVMAAGETLLLAINEKIDEIYKFASIEVKAKAKALDAIMNQDGYVDSTYKIK